jgi:hypothetical protein
MRVVGVLLSLSMRIKNAVLWDVAQCRFCENPQLCRLHLQASGTSEFFCPGDGDETFLRNVGSLKTYTLPYLIRLYSSQSKLYYDRQSVGQSLCQTPIWDPHPNFPFFFFCIDNCGFLDVRPPL